MTCMEVETIQRSKDPERLVCKAARGDYYDGFIGDTRYKDLMWGVQHDDSHLEGLADILHREGSSIHDYVSYAIEDYFEGEPIDEEIDRRRPLHERGWGDSDTGARRCTDDV